MICPYCGRENPENAQNCDYCGASLVLPAEEHIPETASIEPQVSIDHTPAPAPLSDTTLDQPPPEAPRGILSGNKIWWFAGCLLVLVIIIGCGVVVWGLFNISDRLAIFNPTNQTPESTIIANPLSLTPAVIFADDFSNTDSGWDRYDEADYFTDYYENAYRIIVKSDMSDSWANPGSNIFGDVIIEADVTKNAGPDDNDFGLICRYQSLDEFYYGVISSDGYFGITKVTSDSSDLIGRDNLEFSDAIHQGTTPNHIRFDCIDNVLTLYINGQQVDQQIDSDYSNGNVGLIAGTYDTPGTDVLFDNFFVYKP